MPVDVVIHTRRLLLRPLQPGDADALFGVFGDPLVMRHWSTPPWADRTPGEAMIELDRNRGNDADWLRLGLVRRDDDRLLGTCTLFDHQAGSRRCEVGYALARAAWGQGLMHEALTALIDHGFGALALNRIEADIDPRNQASARTLRRLGFVQEGLLRERWIVAGEVSDSALWGLLRRDWLAGGGEPTSVKTPT
jgi:RimJ/RimL family protein N-acetyltransferase